MKPDKDEVKRFEVRAVREALAKQLLGVTNPAELAATLTRARAQKAEMSAAARPPADPAKKLPRGVEVKPAAAPRKLGIVSGSGVFVRVSAKETFRSAVLRLKLDEKRIRHLRPETILLARLDEKSKRFRAVAESRYLEDRGYVSGRIDRPGLYTAIGLPRDPRIVATMGLLHALRDWRGLDPKLDFNPKICGLILCSPDFARAKPAAFAGTAFGAGDFVGGPPGMNVCELCLGGGLDRGTLDIFHGHGFEFGREPRPVVPPARSCDRWSFFGPDNISGRITALSADPTDGKIMYAGSAAGGVFRTMDAGSTWEPLWSEQLSMAIGGLSVAPSDRRVIYAGTGEWDIFVSAIYVMYPGVGVYRSRDAGATWQRAAPISSTETAAVAVHPGNADRVFVAGDKALHRSADGGQSWDIPTGNTHGVLDGVVSDVVIDPDTPDRIYAGVHHSAGRTGGIYRSVDGGNTWNLLTNGIASGAAADGPRVALGRNGVHGTSFVAAKMSNQVYTSIDGGNSFTQASDPGFMQQMGRYMNVIAVDPDDESILFAGEFNLHRSTDGGATWTNVSTAAAARKNRIHEDLHALLFDPADRNKVFVASDGGVYKSTDNGRNWEALHGAGGIPADPYVNSGLATLQCWTVAVSQTPKLAVAVTTHDNYSYAWSSARTFTMLNYLNRGEGGWVEYDPKNIDVVYSDNWFSNVVKTSNGTAWWQQQTWTDLGIDTDNLNLESLSIARGNTSLLLAIKKQTGVVARSSNGGSTWSDVLAITGLVSAVQFAPSDDNHAYVASDNGRVWHSTDAGATWTELLRAGLPNARVHDIEVDHDDPLRVFLAFGTRGALAAVGYRPLWRGAIGAGNQARWFDVSGASPAVSLPDLGLTGLALDPSFDDAIYVSNIVGVFRSADGGDSWKPFDEGLPNTFVSDLDVRRHDRSLWVSTMGRGVWSRSL